MINSTPEPMVISLVWNVEVSWETFGMYRILALLPLHSDTLDFRGLATDWSGSRFTFLLVDSHINFIVQRLLVLNSYGVRSTNVDINLLGDLPVHKVTIFPSDFPTVLITSPDFLSRTIDHPLGVTLFLGDIGTDRHLLHFGDGLLLISYGTGLLGEGLCGGGVIMEDVVGGDVGTAGVSYYLTCGNRYRDTDLPLLSTAVPGHLVRAEVHGGGVELNLTVLGDVHTVVIMSISMVVD